jgi:hypothetical protein
MYGDVNEPEAITNQNYAYHVNYKTRAESSCGAFSPIIIIGYLDLQTFLPPLEYLQLQIIPRH